MPTSINDDEKRVRCYLLRLASEEELDQIEETFLATSDHAELISDAERRLIADYVQRRLSDEEKRAFEQEYLVTNERREQVAIAQALGEMQNAVPQEAYGQRVLGEERPHFWRRVVDWIAAPGPVVGFATAVITVVLLSANAVQFLRWRNQEHQTEVASQQIRELQASKKTPAPPGATVHVIGIPVLKLEETNLSAGEVQKLTFRLPLDLPDTIQIPLELPAAIEEATIDVVVSFSGRSVWSEPAVHLRRAGTVLQAGLTIPFSVLRQYIGQPLKLEVVERGHADLGTFQLTFEVEK